ncbi:MAG TPA: hypothetical protein VNT55_07120 [Baekduia sp.]|nr:hypothetical protein [Baekduia sp.]
MVAVTAALGVAATGTASSPPVLGAKAYAPSGTGFGTAHPKTFHNGGDPSGLVSHIAWKHWGAASAYGTGKNALFRPEGGYYSKLATVKLRAYDLGRCPGSQRRAYRRLKFRAPRVPGGKLGPWVSWSGAKTICTAP